MQGRYSHHVPRDILIGFGLGLGNHEETKMMAAVEIINKIKKTRVHCSRQSNRRSTSNPHIQSIVSGSHCQARAT